MVKIFSPKGHAKVIDESSVEYWEKQGWSVKFPSRKEEIVLKPVKKTAHTKPAVEEPKEEIPEELKEVVGDDNSNKGE